MSLKGWEPLKCVGCESEEFSAVHNITYHESQGTASKQTGWKCAKCGTVAATDKMIQAVKIQDLKKRQKEIEDQILNG